MIHVSFVLCDGPHTIWGSAVIPGMAPRTASDVVAMEEHMLKELATQVTLINKKTRVAIIAWNEMAGEDGR